MREIKFQLVLKDKVIDIDRVEWRKGMPYRAGYFDREFDKTRWFYLGTKLGYKLRQNTDLKDKNGVEIYEGDVVTSKRCPEAHFSCTCTKVPQPEFTDAVVFQDGAFQAPGLEWPLVNYEVIGNIYENPGFLESPKEDPLQGGK